MSYALRAGIKKIKKRTKLPLMVAVKRSKMLPWETVGNVLSLAPPNATPSNTLWLDKSRGYEVSLTNAVAGDFSQGTAGWNNNGSGAVLTASNGIMVVAGDGTSAFPRAAFPTAIPYVSGRKLLLVAKLKVGSISCQSLTIDVTATGMATQPLTQLTPVNNTAYPLFGVVTLPAGGSGNISCRVVHGYADAATANGKAIEVQEVMCIDLTTPFQATREPSIADINIAMAEANTTFWNGAKTLRFRNNATLSNFAGSATSGWVQEWIECQTGDSKNVVNLLGADGNFGVDSNADGLADGWIKEGTPTVSVTGNVQKVTPASQFHGIGSNTAIRSQNVGDKIYGFMFMLSTSNLNRLTLAEGTGGVSQSKTHSGSGAFEFMSVQGTLASKIDSGFRVVTALTSGFSEFQIKQAHLLNLTTIFGAGNEPTQAEMDKIVQRAIAAYGYISTRTLKLAKRWMLRCEGTDDFGSLTNSPSLDLGVVAGKEQAWAVVFRVGIGAGSGYLQCKNSTSFADNQFAVYYDAVVKYIRIAMNGGDRHSTQALIENEFYSLIFYRNKLGVITPILNNISKPTATYANALTTQPNVRIGRRETAAGHFKGDIAWQGMWEADTLNIEAIKRSVNNIAKDYLAA